MNKKQQGTLTIIGATLAVAGAIAAGVNFSNNSESNLQTSTPGYSLQTEAIESSSASEVQSSTVPATETKTESSTHEIPFQTQTVNDNTLAKGTTKVTTQGVNGLEEITYSVTYVDGEETDREIIETVTIKEPVTQVIAQGTYVAPKPSSNNSSTTQKCTNGTYINSNGQTVCRPSPTNNGDASAICNDGTYSHSQHRRGTCSKHKGVRTWLKDLPD